MELLPKDLEDIIMDYKEQMEMAGKRKLIFEFIIDSVEHEVECILEYGMPDGHVDSGYIKPSKEWKFKDINEFRELQMDNLLKLSNIELDFHIMLAKKLEDMYKVDKEYMTVSFECSGFCWTKTNKFILLNER